MTWMAIRPGNLRIFSPMNFVIAARGTIRFYEDSHERINIDFFKFEDKPHKNDTMKPTYQIIILHEPKNYSRTTVHPLNPIIHTELPEYILLITKTSKIFTTKTLVKATPKKKKKQTCA
jgi:hypothetical protein